MALLTKQPVGLPGRQVTMAACAGGGDTVAVDTPGCVIKFFNGDASAKTITIVDPGTKYGVANADQAQSVPAGQTWEFLIPLDYVDASGIVSITYSAVTSCTIAVTRY